MPALRKPLLEISADDIRALVPDWAEDEQLEFKLTLSHSSSGKPDPWLADQQEIGTPAKRDLLAEVVAFANSYGGDLVLGVGESEDKPPKATSLNMIPECEELAHRFELIARDLIRPQIPMLSIRGVPMEGKAGVVVFRVPKSRLAPHRLEMKGIDKDCYRRSGERTEVMSMREIQDMTFAVARGLDSVQRFHEDWDREVRDWNTRAQGEHRSFAYKVAAVPHSSDLYLDKVHGVSQIQPTSRAYKVKLYAKPGFEFGADGASAPYDFRPTLRGTVGTVGDDKSWMRIQRLQCDCAVVDLSRMRGSAKDEHGQRSDFLLYPGWLFGTIIDTLENVERIRTHAGAASTQYALSISIATTHPLRVLQWGNSWYQTAGIIAPGLTKLPTYEMGERAEWGALLTLIHQDFWNSIGVADDHATITYT